MFKNAIKKLILKFYLVLVCFCFYLQPSNSTEVIVTNPEIADLSGGTITNGTCVGGSSHLNLLTNNSEAWSGSPTLQWGACSDTFAMNMAINEVLSDAGTGISLDKIHYRWKWINGCFNITKENGDKVWCSTDIENRLDENMKPTGEYADQFDTLNIVIELSDSNGNIIETRTYDYDTWYHWSESNSHSTNETADGEGAVWQITEDHIELFNHITGSGTIYTPNQLGSINFIANGQDNGQWDGYYGPVARDGEMWFTYRNNPCDLDILYNPTCPGYAEAYAEYLYDKACSANPLYDIGCSGYQVAYLDQQCTYDPLYDVQCPLYQVAYFNKQCELDPQYDVGCPGYVVQSVEDISSGNDTEIAGITPVNPVNPVNVTVPLIPEIPLPIDPMPIELVTPEIEVVQVEEITTESIEIEIAAIEAEVNEPIATKNVEETNSERDNGEDTGEDTGGDTTTQETEKPEPEKTDESGSEADGKSEEASDDEQSESKDDDRKEKDSGEDTSTTDGDAKDKELDEGKDTNETVEPEKVAKPTKKKEKSRKDKMRQLIANKVNALTKKVEKATTIEEQMVIQAQLLALVAFVPDFDYAEKKVPDIYFYPPVPTVDHEFSRWFVNDPTFGAMENLQYPSLRQ